MNTRWLVLMLILVVPACAQTATQNVLLVTIDGLRWQEVFTGAEEALFDRENGGVPDNIRAALRADFWAESPEARRRKLMPFVWETIAAQGQIFGHRTLGSVADVLNTAHSSYPGYNEMLAGRVDPVIVSNTPILNPNVTVLEWLHARPGYDGRIAAAAQWTVFTAILNPPRSRLPVWVARRPTPPGLATPRMIEIDRWKEDIPPIAPEEHFDAFVYRAAVEIYETRRPRVFLLALGEPDSWAHARRYDRYLESIRRCDRFVRSLWEKLQAWPEYRGTTSLLVTTDHGRGVTPQDWNSHGTKIPRSGESWLMALGPDTPARGERRETMPVHQTQVAATIAAWLGEDFRRAFQDAAPPIADVLSGSSAR